jgi:membrane protease YdiL (CAAX protease family)
MGTSARQGKLGLLVRLGVYVLLVLVGLPLFSAVAYAAGDILVAAALGTFAAAAVANALALRIWERGRLADIGMHWNAASRRNLAVGVAGGAGAALLALGVPLLVGAAALRPDPDYPASWASFLFLSVVLLFGAVGEELLFRGYGFQILLAELGPFATILPASVIFGLAHTANQHATPLALANTTAWGVILGLAFLRSGDLWLPIGLHFGWNWILPILGAGLSGFTIRTGGYAMEWRASSLWSGGAYGPEGGLVTTLVLCALALYLWKAPILGQTPYLARGRKER